MISGLHELLQLRQGRGVLEPGNLQINVSPRLIRIQLGTYYYKLQNILMLKALANMEFRLKADNKNYELGKNFVVVL